MTSIPKAHAFDIRKLLLGLAVASASVLALSACNTVEGAGEDVESAGEAIQDGADND
jgi:predicted small secreted protein